MGRLFDSNGKAWGSFAASTEYFQYKAEQIPQSHPQWHSETKESEDKSKDACALHVKPAILLSDYDTGEFPITLTMHYSVGALQTNCI